MRPLGGARVLGVSLAVAMVAGTVSPAFAEPQASSASTPADKSADNADKPADKATDKASCVAALDRAQKSESEKKLQRARADFVACASEACPTAVREDCAKSLLAVDTALPTVVFSVTSETGEDVTDVRVEVDGVLAMVSLDGRAFALDPGPHTVRFDRRGARVETTVVAREGEKARVVRASFEKKDPRPSLLPVPQPAPNATAPAVVRVETREVSSPPPVLPIALGVLGTAGLGTALYFRVRADSDAKDLRDTCAPACAQGERDALSSKLVVANVSLVVGLTLLGSAALTWIFTPQSTHVTTRSSFVTNLTRGTF